MIKDDQDLATTQRYARSVEASLAELRRKLKDKFPRRYEVLSRRYLEELALLREQIDAYLQVSTTGNADLSLALKGISFGSAPISAVTGSIEAVRRGIQTLAGLLTGTEPGHIGRRARPIELASDLQLAAIGSGSVRIDLNLPASSQLEMFAREDVGGRATALFVRVAEWAAGDADPAELLQALGTIRPALAAWQVLKAVPSQTSAVQRVVVSGRLVMRPVVLDAKTRIRLTQLIYAGRQVKKVAEEGAVRSLDLDAGTFNLRWRPGKKSLRCLFEPMFLEKEVLAAAGHRVIVHGELLLDPVTDVERELLTESIEITDRNKPREPPRGKKQPK